MTMRAIDLEEQVIALDTQLTKAYGEKFIGSNDELGTLCVNLVGLGLMALGIADKLGCPGCDYKLAKAIRTLLETRY